MELITTAEVAKLLGVSARTVHRMVAAEELTPVKQAPGPRGVFLFDADTIEPQREAS